jgi:hypothetical protein
MHVVCLGILHKQRKLSLRNSAYCSLWNNVLHIMKEGRGTGMQNKDTQNCDFPAFFCALETDCILTLFEVKSNSEF